MSLPDHVHSHTYTNNIRISLREERIPTKKKNCWLTNTNVCKNRMASQRIGRKAFENCSLVWLVASRLPSGSFILLIL